MALITFLPIFNLVIIVYRKLISSSNYPLILIVRFHRWGCYNLPISLGFLKTLNSKQASFLCMDLVKESSVAKQTFEASLLCIQILPVATEQGQINYAGVRSGKLIGFFCKKAAQKHF